MKKKKAVPRKPKIEVETEFRSRTAVHRVRCGDSEFTLSAPEKALRPDEFELYIWSLPFTDRGTSIIKGTIEQITATKVLSVDWSTGNGHGGVEVVYEARPKVFGVSTYEE